MEKGTFRKAIVSRIGIIYFLCIFYSFLILLPSCIKDAVQSNQYDQIKPKGTKTAWGPTITPQMQTVIETLDSISPTPLYTLNAAAGAYATLCCRCSHACYA